VALELLFAAGVAGLPVAPGPHVGHRLGQIQVPQRGLDVVPLLGWGQLGPDRQRLGRVAKQPGHRVRRILLGEKLVDPRAIERPTVPLLRRPPHQGRTALVSIQRRQCLVGASELLAQLLGRSERTVPLMRCAIGPFAGCFEPGDHRDAPAKQPAELLLGLTPQVSDVPEGLGVAALLFADPLPEGGSFASHPHRCPFRSNSSRCICSAGPYRLRRGPASLLSSVAASPDRSG
jgi:hypothetical protein